MVKDWLTGKVLDTQSLLDLANISEQAPFEQFELRRWYCVARCGFAGCLVGNFCAARPSDALRLRSNPRGDVLPRLRDGESQDESYNDVAVRFGLTYPESVFLFSPCDMGGANRPQHAEPSVQRVRKFLYYKLRKAELLADYEQARRTGDVGLAQETKQQAQRHFPALCHA